MAAKKSVTGYAVTLDGALRPNSVRATMKTCRRDFTETTGLSWKTLKPAGFACRKVVITLAR